MSERVVWESCNLPLSSFFCPFFILSPSLWMFEAAMIQAVTHHHVRVNQFHSSIWKRNQHKHSLPPFVRNPFFLSPSWFGFFSFRRKERERKKEKEREERKRRKEKSNWWGCNSISSFFFFFFFSKAISCQLWLFLSLSTFQLDSFEPKEGREGRQCHDIVQTHQNRRKVLVWYQKDFYQKRGGRKLFVKMFCVVTDSPAQNMIQVFTRRAMYNFFWFPVQKRKNIFLFWHAKLTSLIN